MYLYVTICVRGLRGGWDVLGSFSEVPEVLGGLGASKAASHGGDVGSMVWNGAPSPDPIPFSPNRPRHHCQASGSEVKCTTRTTSSNPVSQDHRMEYRMARILSQHGQGWTYSMAGGPLEPQVVLFTCVSMLRPVTPDM